MPTVLALTFYIVAAVCFALAAFGAPLGRVNLIALGLLAWVLVPLWQTAAGG